MRQSMKRAAASTLVAAGLLAGSASVASACEKKEPAVDQPVVILNENTNTNTNDNDNDNTNTNDIAITIGLA
ncbi:hypothetical protein ABZ568_19275 [Streptomyces olindensis]|uniref:Uncharacterized protein n=1 Tax=Streptomyces olindensis TaxID=358823 RepID=A0ABV2XWU9_9ACTN|nr:hypothetical protein DF19_26190 [Streptomyces olindensis]